MKIKELSHSDVLDILPDRKPDSHKGDYGRILLLCGSKGYTGAAALSAMGALRAGAGLVYLAVPESIYQIEAVKLTEPIVVPLQDEDGKMAIASIDKICKLMDQMDAVLVGPGIGQSNSVTQVVKTVLEMFPGPVIVDADGINALTQHKDILRGRTAPTILTPHPGEFMRLAGDIGVDRMESARNLAKELGVIVVLKGHNTVITDGERCYINKTGNPGMAVGGSGDVLAGMITALVGIGLKPIDAASCGAWLHGAAGDLCSQELGQYAMLPSDVLDALPRLLK